MSSPEIPFPVIHSEQPCLLCGSHDAFVIGTKGRDGSPLRTVISRQSGLVWTDPRPSTREIDAYYSQLYRLSYKGTWHPKAKHIYRSGRVARERYSQWESFIGPARTMLDIGASAGEFVYLMRKLGKTVSGIEPNEAYAEWAKRHLGVPVQTATWKDAVFPEESFDIITSFHVFEHLEDPLAALQRVSRWLRVGGVAIIEVPNIECEVGNPSRRFHYAHLYNFNEATLRMLGNKAGLQIAATRVSDDTGNVTVVFRKPETPQPVPPGVLPGNCSRVLSVLMRCTQQRYLLAPDTWGRLLGKGSRFVAEALACKRTPRPRELLKTAFGL